MIFYSSTLLFALFIFALPIASERLLGGFGQTRQCLKRAIATNARTAKAYLSAMQAGWWLFLMGAIASGRAPMPCEVFTVAATIILTGNTKRFARFLELLNDDACKKATLYNWAMVMAIAFASLFLGWLLFALLGGFLLAAAWLYPSSMDIWIAKTNVCRLGGQAA